MGNTYGRTSILTVGRSIRLSADGRPEVKHIGVTICWDTVAAAGADTVLNDGVQISTGDKYLRYGQVICKITAQETQTVDLSGADDPTGGTWDLTILGVTVTDIAYNVSAADLQTAIRAACEGLPYGNDILVSKAGFVYTITFPPGAENVAEVTVDDANLTTGSASSITVTITTTNAGVSCGGEYGPYDPDATDGRQTLTRGACYLVDMTVKETDLHSDHPPVIEGGLVFKDRVIQSGVAVHSLALGPTFAELNAVFPRLRYVAETPE